MTEPLSVAVGIVEHDAKVLLINRERGAYTDKWALPGGKIEQEEHVDEAVRREVKEEAGIQTTFEAYEGIVSEHVIEEDTIQDHFILHICRLSPEETVISDGAEGQTRWVSLDERDTLDDAIVRSDHRILQELTDGQFSGYYCCVIDETDERHELVRFESR
ncbi:MAG: NUDIX domain-containing protein [Candidatus Nanohaloarchaeota archaeon QJJ-5]|nr:NUDIX domain-containing protein [Candidatus Nanohaloarchaeota archaeon QJJ-5]